MKNSQTWFSLAELMTVIAIIWILIFWASQINYKPQIDNQNAQLFLNRIYSNIETIRNNALLGKWFLYWGIMIHPSEWVIKIDTSWSGTIEWYYMSGSTQTLFDDFKTSFVNNTSIIRELRCRNPKRTLFSTGTHIDISIQGSTMTLSWCNSSHTAILDIKLKHANVFKTIRLNTLSGLIEKINH